MNWEFHKTKTFDKSLRKIEKKDLQKIFATLEKMLIDPLGGDCKKLKDYHGEFRTRTGNWRIFFQIDFQNEIIYFKDVRRRTGNTYKKKR